MKRASVAASLMLSCLLLVPPAQQTEARFCAGDMERVRVLFEWVGSLLDRLANRMVHLADQSTRIGFQSAARLALWTSFLESRDQLTSLSDKSAISPKKVSGLEEFRSAIEPFWKRVYIIREQLSSSPQEINSQLDLALRSALSTLWLCQAVQNVRPEYCDLLQSLAPSERQKCLYDVFRIGILYRGRCSESNLAFSAELIKAEPDQVRQLCQILTSRQQHRCDSISKDRDAKDGQWCLALTGQGQAACNDQRLSENETKDCLQELRIFEIVTGIRSVDELKVASLGINTETAIRSVVNAQPCQYLALSKYDKFSRTFFFLEE